MCMYFFACLFKMNGYMYIAEVILHSVSRHAICMHVQEASEQK